ncbi:MAG: hypothetical protein ACM3PU_01595 [Gemmatimonadota bacterium]
MKSERVAVVAVHGIADQRPGQTVRELAHLLCDVNAGASAYTEGETRGVLIPVRKLEPGAEAGARASVAGRERWRPGAPSGFYRARRAASVGTEQAPRDLGAALNDYLLQQHQLAEGDALYESTRVSLRRGAEGSAVDIYEMYWADLSRLRPGGVRALTALYQLFFHLSTLARDIVDQVVLAVGAGRGWRILQRLHAWSAWLMTGPAALIQLAMLLLVPFGAASLVPQTQRAFLLAATASAAAALLAVAAVVIGLREPTPRRRWSRAVPLLLAAAGAVAVAITALRGSEPAPDMYFATTVLVVGAVGATLVARFARVARGAGPLGHGLIAGVCAALLLEAWRTRLAVTTLSEWMLTCALHVGEFLLATMLIAWAALVLVQIAALVLGLVLERGHDEGVRASLYTARVGMVLSAALFAVLSLVLWSVITYVAGLSISDFDYAPIVFGTGYRGVAIFLESRVQSVGSFFTPLVAAGVLLAVAALLVLAPSLREELAPTPNLDGSAIRPDAARWAPRLGRWLSGGLSRLGDVVAWLVPLLAIAGGAIYVGFVVDQLLPGASAARWLAGVLEQFRGEALVATGKWLAGGALTIAALGARFTQTFGRLRVLLDAVLDIDNYFADPPDRQPPRARIFARYASLLAYLRERGYARIVIVAHSQGTVISADLLRHLHRQSRLRAIVGERPIALVTVGSPLRDLYVARFPLLYRWMGSSAADFVAAQPSAADLGATAWVNAYRSGDYVGRAIWMAANDHAIFRVAAIGSDGTVQAKRAGDRTEFCLGAGAHTHYFSGDAVALAKEIDCLIAMR